MHTSVNRVLALAAAAVLTFAAAAPARGEAILQFVGFGNENVRSGGGERNLIKFNPSINSTVSQSISLPGITSTGTYTLSSGGFNFSVVHDSDTDTGTAESTYKIFFGVTETTAYTLSGLHTIPEDDDGFEGIVVSSVSLGTGVDEDAEPIALFFDIVVNSNTGTRVLGTPGVSGSLTGILEPGVIYNLQYTYQSQGRDSSANLSLALTPTAGGGGGGGGIDPGEVTPVPLPGAAWGGLALIGGLGAFRRFGRRNAAASSDM